VAAALAYVDVTFANGETNGSDERWGRYQAFLPNGVYTLKFAARGYLPRLCTIELAAGDGCVVDVPMIPGLGDRSDETGRPVKGNAEFAASDTGTLVGPAFAAADPGLLERGKK
jgi:hypothetical protein